MYRIIGLQLLDYNQSCTYLNFGKADDFNDFINSV